MIQYPLFDFNDHSGRFGFTPLHFSIYQANFTILNILLNSEEKLNHEALDQEGRVPLQLCNAMSSVYKLMNREYKKSKE